MKMAVLYWGGGISEEEDCQKFHAVFLFRSVTPPPRVSGSAPVSPRRVVWMARPPRLRCWGGNDAATFKSMLYGICDFSRHRGDGLWSLKPEFR